MTRYALPEKSRAGINVFDTSDDDDFLTYMMGRAGAARSRPDPFFNMFDRVTVGIENDQPGMHRAFGKAQDHMHQYMRARSKSTLDHLRKKAP